MKQETIAVPVELVRELKRLAERCMPKRLRSGFSESLKQLAEAIDDMPDPPKPDPVEECAIAYRNKYSAADLPVTGQPTAMRAALRRYRELLGLPADPELGDG